jgi:hypothetical protein
MFLLSLEGVWETILVKAASILSVRLRGAFNVVVELIKLVLNSNSQDTKMSIRLAAFDLHGRT